MAGLTEAGYSGLALPCRAGSFSVCELMFSNKRVRLAEWVAKN